MWFLQQHAGRETPASSSPRAAQALGGPPLAVNGEVLRVRGGQANQILAHDGLSESGARVWNVAGDGAKDSRGMRQGGAEQDWEQDWWRGLRQCLEISPAILSAAPGATPADQSMQCGRRGRAARGSSGFGRGASPSEGWELLLEEARFCDVAELDLVVGLYSKAARVSGAGWPGIHSVTSFHP